MYVHMYIGVGRYPIGYLQRGAWKIRHILTSYYLTDVCQITLINLIT